MAFWWEEGEGKKKMQAYIRWVAQFGAIEGAGEPPKGTGDAAAVWKQLGASTRGALIRETFGEPRKGQGTLVRGPNSATPREVPLDEVQVPDCWHAMQFLDEQRRDGFSSTVHDTWTLAHDLLIALRTDRLFASLAAAKAATETATETAPNTVKVPARVRDGLVNVIRHIARGALLPGDAETLIAGAFAGMGVEVEP